MNFSDLKTQVSNKIERSDISGRLGTWINSSIRQLENEEDWPDMETRSTGSLTASVDYVAIPARYKNVRSFIITDSDRQKILRKLDYEAMIISFPYGSTSAGTPKTFARKQSESKFYVRPYPDKNYNYELITNVYSADLSADSDSNYWTNNNWELVLYGALIQYELEYGTQLKLGTEESPLSPAILYMNMLNMLKRNLIKEKYLGSPNYSSIHWVY